MWTESARALLTLSQRLPHGSEVYLYGHGPSSIAASRNEIVQWFLDGPREWEWLLFVDSDMTPPPHALERLHSHNLDMVSAAYFERIPPHLPVGNLFPASEPGQVVREATRVGFGCVLVRRRVIEALRAPWFEHPVPGMGEDSVFCDKVRRAGFRIHLDLGVVAGHISPIAVGSTLARAWRGTDEGREQLAEARANLTERRPEWLRMEEAPQ